MELTEKQRTLLKGQIEEFLKTKNSEDDWCVACGAGAAESKDLLSRDPEIYRQFTSKETINDLLTSPTVSALIQKSGSNMWCVACGAGKSKSLGEDVINPAMNKGSSAEIDKAMTKVIEILKE
ncbi:hypothetical protein MSBRW_3389 [Methanosarcina barkeri str. Wiesmoor]|uniref:Uncharacterized protein n=2 Tax=Methanosarcina barkeri TaxID=2208 RepID=A0A0E3QQX4_METBA|nr:hypothetical protein [Methanosarcina barkeri]AKB52642.1 hypothetical protein MSBRW_3389 [Methanosarcina barkeri str. Wiesmoor]